MNGAMRSTLRLALRLALALSAGCGTQAPAPTVDVTGTWAGSVDSNAGPPLSDPLSTATGSRSSSPPFSLTISTPSAWPQARGLVGGCRRGGAGGSRLGDSRPANSTGRVILTGTVQNPGPANLLMDVAYQGTPW